LKLRKKIVTLIKDLREERNIKQQELADLAGVSRQTIYYLEKGTYIPSLTMSFKNAKVFNKFIEEIFYFEPIIRDILGGKTLDELEIIAERSDVKVERILKLKNLNDENLLKVFIENELFKISEALGVEFDTIFLRED